MYFDILAYGKRIAGLRKAKGLSQPQLAEELNMSYDHLAHIEIGQRSCSIDLMITIAQYFNVSLDYLIIGKEQNADRLRPMLQEAISLLNKVEADLIG